MDKKYPKPVVLLILDGWGIAPKGEGNPLRSAKTPVLDDLIAQFPAMTLQGSAEAVGLSWGEMGNSEVGHLTIGAGRVFYQSFPRINLTIQSGEFFQNKTLVNAAQTAKKNKSAFHIIGINSQGNVHGSDQHIHALLEIAKQQGLKNVFVHPILDGRDTIFNSGVIFIKELEKKMNELKVGKIASVSGRYYAMDRDNRWDRTQKAYEAMTGAGTVAQEAEETILESYERNIFDEEFVPVTITKKNQPIGPIQDGDVVVFANFRPDRAIQLTKAFTEPELNRFPREHRPDITFLTMTEYEQGLKTQVVFPPEKIETCLAEAIAKAGLKQLHIAETEKYAHVTYFINAMTEEPFEGETRVIVPSPKVASYDTVPEMAASKITEKIVESIKKGTHDVIIANFANADMVGHTGNFEATKQAAEVIDKEIGKITAATLTVGGVVLITADHGNAEEVKNLQTGAIDKEHSTNPVPFIVVGEKWRGQQSPSGEVPEGDLSLVPVVGVLADVAQTMLSILKIPQPTTMTGSALV